MTKSPWCGTINYHTKEVFVMSDGFKGFAWVLLILGTMLFLISFVSGGETTLFFGIAGIVTSIPLFISSGFCKIMEDTRDTLKQIETLLQNKKEE